MTDSRCHRCDRAECPAWTAPPQTDAELFALGDAELFALGDAERDCDRHAISPEQWRTRALAAESARDAAERRAATAEEYLRAALDKIESLNDQAAEMVPVLRRLGVITDADVSMMDAAMKASREALAFIRAALAPAAESGKETP